MDIFVENGEKCPNIFVFWGNYPADFSQLLLDFIAAKRDPNKCMVYETLAEMIPLDFQCGHINYAESRLMEAERPKIHEPLVESQGAIYQTRFSGVWHYMAIEQSIGLGLYQKYYMTEHLKAAATTMTKQMCELKGL